MIPDRLSPATDRSWPVAVRSQRFEGVIALVGLRAGIVDVVHIRRSCVDADL